MDQLLTIEKPTLQQQIEFVRHFRTDTVRVLKTSEVTNMFMQIEENLLAVKTWNFANANTPAELVTGVGKVMQELIEALHEGKESTKYWRLKIVESLPEAERERIWNDYQRQNPVMIQINALIAKYENAGSYHFTNPVKEVSNG